ncbi:MAG: VCBS repeat-containing protein, partial [Acidobacteria bacterium]|nr:VCBS repeat-containing protein [Acidobacteriota bacterium]
MRPRSIVLSLAALAAAATLIPMTLLGGGRSGGPFLGGLSRDNPAVEDVAAPQTVAGMIDAELSITPNGSASYVVPLKVPPGTNGVAPNLSLAYNNQAPNGILGMGWSLHGLSSITRCAATKVPDGYVGAVRFDAKDRFCLDGIRLVLVGGGAYGAAGSVYHTEQETWTKVTAAGTCGSGPCSFTALNKDGTTLEFGTTDDSRVPIPDRSEVFAWKIHRTVDLNHNTVEVSYQQDPGNGENYPQVIAYTGNTATGLAAGRSVSFTWEDRTDVVPLYVGGFETKETKRLAKLTTTVSSQTVMEYRFSYRESTGTERSLLRQIDQCAPDPDNAGSFLCLNPTSFDWQVEDNTVTSPNSDPNGKVRQDWCPLERGYTAFWADFDGDGRVDLTCSAPDGSQYVLLSTGTGLKSPNSDPDGLLIRDWCSFSTAVTRWVDFNGDGKADLHCDDDRGSHWVMLSTGTALKSPNQSSDGLVESGWCPSSIGIPHWINFDGDGRADLTCATADGSHYVLISDGSALSSPNGNPDGLVRSNWCAGSAADSYWGDFNGDGMSDLNCSQQDGSHYVLLSTGTGVESPNADPDGKVLANWCAGKTGDRKFATTDFNGDRLFDFGCHL